jgi:hypothetical protein
MVVNPLGFIARLPSDTSKKPIGNALLGRVKGLLPRGYVHLLWGVETGKASIKVGHSPRGRLCGL